MREYLKNVAIKYCGDYPKIRHHVLSEKQCETFNYDGKFITLLDEEYPSQLKSLQDPPYVLFYEGNLNLLKAPMISIVGNRAPSDYSKSVTHKLVMKLKKRYVIVSGLAKGIDALAHQNALTHATIAVVANGIDVYYPKINIRLQTTIKHNHLIISEYPNGVQPKKTNFPTRNRIIAALGSKLIVTSAKERSGTVCTVNHALNLNKEIIVLPHQIDDVSGRGCNEMIQEGASMLTNLDDLSNI